MGENNGKRVKTVKGFDENLKCRDFQYEVGGQYKIENDDPIMLCHNGFHAIAEDQDPISVFEYYPPAFDGKRSRYCEVEVGGNIDTDGIKIAGSEIKVGPEIGVPGIIKAHTDWVKSRTTNKNNTEVENFVISGDHDAATAGYRGAATAGNYGAATAGYCGAATAGENGAATAGDNGAATAGNCGAATAGMNGTAVAGNWGGATAGECGGAIAGNWGGATAGDQSAATAGDYGAATAGENGAATVGDNGAATAGNCGAATAGDQGAATAGNHGAATAGNCGAATAGDHGAATAGDYGAATASDHGGATAGYRGAATAGEYGTATAGEYGTATSRGSVSVGTNGVGCVRGTNVKIKGGLGAILMIAVEESNTMEIKEWKTIVVDGQSVKENTWYTLENGNIIEAENTDNTKLTEKIEVNEERL